MHSSIEPSVLMTIPVVVKSCGLSKVTIYHEVKAGRLRAFKIGRSIRFRVADYEAWIDSYAAAA
jgi:excisionase family DNA binding protein